MYKLVISDDEGKTTVVPLVRDEITIGRKEGNTIRLTERNVSRRHARLARQDGQFVIHDLDSYNGVRINGRRIAKHTALQAGDKVVIGDYVLALQSEDKVAPTATPGAAAAPPARLVMLTPPAPGAEFAIPEGNVRIGRAEDLDVWVNHRSISREHAEIRRKGNQFELLDLESANGVRLNAQEVTQATLSPGDEIELGQVRFRFVGEGERYSFEADRTIQMDALVLPEEEGGSRKGLFIGLAILLVAALILLVLLPGGETEDTPVVTPIENTNPTPEPEGDPELDRARQLLAATEACVAALRDQDFARARAAADEALAIDPDSVMASDCQRRASNRVGAQEQFQEGVDHFEAGRIEDAWMAFDSLPSDSAFRDREEVAQARSAFVRHYLDAAHREADSDNRAEALQQLQQVFAVGDENMDAEAIADARALERTLSAQATAMRPRNPRNPNRRPPRMDTRPVMTEMTQVTPMESPMTQTMAPQARLTPQEIMRQCNFQNRCVVERMENGPKNATTIPFLIEAYRNIGNSSRTRSLMEQYVRRWPNGPRAQSYRRMLETQR